MSEYMYGQDSFLVVGLLLLSMLLAIELGQRLGRAAGAGCSEAARSHVESVQSSLLGILALLLGFTFSLALQRFDSRSEAVIEEANAIGTALLRAQLVDPGMRPTIEASLREYLDLRVRDAAVSLEQHERHANLRGATAAVAERLWSQSRQLVALAPAPVPTGLYVQALNDMLDAMGRRDAELDRHVPEPVLLLLYLVFVISGGVMGYNIGVSGHRPYLVTYVMVLIITLLVLIIIDIDRPQRGYIRVSPQGLLDLQTALGAGWTAPVEPASAAP